MERVADLLRQTFDAPDAAPLDPALIRLMLELAHAPDDLPRPIEPPHPEPSAIRRLPVARALPLRPLLALRSRLRVG